VNSYILFFVFRIVNDDAYVNTSTTTTTITTTGTNTNEVAVEWLELRLLLNTWQVRL
jgi:hypothetical protein